MLKERQLRWSRTMAAVFAVAAVTSGMVVLATATPGRAASPPQFRTEACPAIYTTGTCLGANFTHGETTGDNLVDDDDAPPPSSDPDPDPPPTDGGEGEGEGDGVGPPAPPTTPPPPSPQQVQQQLLQRANTYFRQPEVTVDAGQAADVDVDTHVGIATFVEVTNWQGQQVDRYSQFDPWRNTTYTVTITATPRLSFDPAEPGAPVIRCEDGGTRYDPDGPSIEEQASRPGACAYAYRMRTGVPGRPDAWPAEVVIDWTVEWTANFPLPPDLPTSATLTESVPREVAEVSTVVTD